MTSYIHFHREPRSPVTGVPIMQDPRWPPAETRFSHNFATNSHRIMNEGSFCGFLTSRISNHCLLALVLLASPTL